MKVELKFFFSAIAIIALCLVDRTFQNVPKGHVICLLSDRPMSWVILFLLATIALRSHLKHHLLRDLAIIGMIFVFL